ncbi:MAG: Rieske 2Fe-2S domain-containing protein [bacterium]|nr:Rieske 2Fe-2S domain-containing protein [bacterium]
MKHTRREFIQHSTMSVGLVASLPLFQTACTCMQAQKSDVQVSNCCNTPTLEKESLYIGDKTLLIDLSKAPSLQQPGHAAFVAEDENNIQLIVIHTRKGTYLALSRFCTHGMQILSFNQEQNHLQCNSFNHSVFGLDGQVLKGPAPKPLQVYPTQLADQKLHITLA